MSIQNVKNSWSFYQDFTEILFRACNGSTVTPLPDNPGKYTMWILSNEHIAEFDRVFAIADDALIKAAATLAAARRLAAAINVTGPTDQQVDNFVKAMNTMNTQIQKEQNIQTAIDIAAALANNVKNMRQA